MRTARKARQRFDDATALRDRAILELAVPVRAAGCRAPGLGPYLLHASATHFVEGGADLKVVPDFLGHASPTTTERHTHVTRGRRLAVAEAFSPEGMRV